VAYFMVSVDTPEDNKRFAEQEGADFPMLSDPQKTMAAAYGVLRDYGQLGTLAQRWTFYIGPDGVIQYIEKSGALQTASAGATLLAKLEELKVPKKK
jgi:peroxiredoxin Q/BCP